MIRNLFAGFLVFFVFTFYHTDATAGEAAPEEEAAATAEAEVDPIHYYKLPPLTVSVIKEGIVAKHKTYVLTLEVVSEDHKVMLKKYQPLLTSEYIRYLHALASKRDPKLLENISFLKSRLKTISNMVLGTPTVQAVLFKAKADQELI